MDQCTVRAPGPGVAELTRFRAEAREGRYVSHYSLAIIQAALGDSEQAFAQLDSAYVGGHMGHVYAQSGAGVRRPARDPRFGRLLKKVGLEP